MNTNIRKIAPDDLETVIALIREFAEFENLADYFEATEQKLAAALFGENSTVEGLLAFDDQVPAGYALFFPNFSSFRAHRGIYLEDIYVSDKYRGQGLGEKLLREIARIAKERGFERIDFNVLDWNQAAIDFYFRLGAVRSDDERHFKFDASAFRELAS